MRTNIKLSMKSLLTIVIVALMTGVLITLSGLLATSIKAAEKDYITAIVGSLGNIIGGFIGAIVAYIVAAYQVQKTFDLEKIKGNSSKYAVLRLLKSELSSNLRLLENFRQDYHASKTDFVNHISIEIWDKCSIQIGPEVTDATLDKIMSVYGKVKLVKNQEKKLPADIYEQLIVDLKAALASIDRDIDTIKE